MTVTAPRPLRRPCNCHCGECRRLSGAAFTTWITAPREQVVIGNPAGLTTFSPTANLRRAFCSRCGSHVFTADARLPGAYGFPAGVFEGEVVDAPGEDYFLDDKADWYHPPA